MKKLISVLLSAAIVFGCLPLISFAAYSDTEKVYTKNTDEVYFNEEYAQVGVPVTVSVKGGGDDLLYKWYIDGEEISNFTDSYTPVESDIESMLMAEVCGADGELIGTANMFISRLPVMYIETENREDIVVKEKRLRAHMKLQGNSEFNDSSVLYDGELEIKGRGNSTWQADKKPYKIKLDTKTSLLGMGKNKHWVLLSNPYDSSLSRNKLIYDLAADMGLDTMSSQWIDVVLNGKVVGNYLLCEHVRVGDTRVDITNWDDIAEDTAKAIYNANKKTMTKAERDELAELMEANMDWVTDGFITYKGQTYTISDYYELPKTNGGYLLEGYEAEEPYFVSDGGYSVSVSSPEGIGKGMLTEINRYYSDFEKAALSSDFFAIINGHKVRYTELADLQSLAKYALVNEVFQNQDFMRRSTYMYKDVDGKLIFGPVWDLDNSSDNSSTNYSHYKWIGMDRAFLSNVVKDPVFVKAFYDSYRKYRYTLIEDMLKPGGDIDKTLEKLSESGENNDRLWSNKVGFEDDLNNFKLWISRRIDWIDTQMASFETLYASLNGSALNNSGASTLRLDGSTLYISSDSENVAEYYVYVNGEKRFELPFENEFTVGLISIPEESVVSVMSYDDEDNLVGMSTVSNYNEPTKLIITKKPDKLTYTSGDSIDLSGLELKAVFADGTEKTVQPEAALSYVSDCLGAQNPVYNKITDEIGNTYVSLRYRGASVDYRVTRTANEDVDKVTRLIEALPQNNISDNLDLIFEAKQEYDALSDSAKQQVKNFEKIDEALKKVDKLAEEGPSPIVGCYIDALSRYDQRNRIVLVAKGTPNKIRVFCDGSTTTLPVSNRTFCISEKRIGGFSLITIVYALTEQPIQIGAYYNHILEGEIYTFNSKKAVENCNRMITSLNCPKTLVSKDKTAELNFTLNERVEKVRATADGRTVTANAADKTAKLDVPFSSVGTKDIGISYFADGEWHSYRNVSVFVREKEIAEYFALKYPAETASDEADVFVAVPDAESVKLVCAEEEISLSKSQKNGFDIWQCTVKSDSGKTYKLFVNSQDTGRTVSVQKVEKLLIKDGVLIKCRAESGDIDIPVTVTEVADGAFDGFTGTVRCYKNSAAHKYAEENGIDFINYGYTLDIPSELTMKIGEKRTVNPQAAPIFAPGFEFTVSSGNSKVVTVSGNTFEAVKPGYARVSVKSNDGLIDEEIRIFIGGGCTKGDINADGKINSLDALLILQESVGKIELNSEQSEAADINSDENINSYDALVALRISTMQETIWNYI
ncbi:MAG: CotH kinase family protein [Acutalibacteraceae bacterium]